MGMKFQLEKMKKFWTRMVVMVTQTRDCTECTPKNYFKSKRVWILSDLLIWALRTLWVLKPEDWPS